MLADPLHGSVRLIDPRGESSPESDVPPGYGDPRYELVKLLHSGLYLYDAVTHDFFHLQHAEGQGQHNEWEAQLVPPKHYRLVSKQLQVICQKRGLSAWEQRWLSASLFFSMLPLHGDSVRRQRLFTLIGCCLVTDSFSILLPCENR